MHVKHKGKDGAFIVMSLALACSLMYTNHKIVSRIDDLMRGWESVTGILEKVNTRIK